MVHNTYQQRGGEDAVVDDEIALLARHGHEVQVYRRNNHEIHDDGRWRTALDTVWSQRTNGEISRLARDFRPDVIHVHNSFPLVSPSLHWAASRAEVPLVQTLHNFRLICPQAMLLREGRICEDCVGHVPWRGVIHRCYRQSALQSAGVAVMLQTHRLLRTWQDKVTLYIALNAFCRDKFVEGGLPASRMRIKPNFVDLPAPPAQVRDGFLFVGRLSPEKGLQVLKDALSQLRRPVSVRVAGVGESGALVQDIPGVSMLGSLAPAQVYARMAGACALLIPSIWYENFPRTLVEAYANGLPVIASRLGALASLVDDGVTGILFDPNSPADLASKLEWADGHPEQMQRMGVAARAHYERHLTGIVNYQELVNIYSEAIQMAALKPV